MFIFQEKIRQPSYGYENPFYAQDEEEEE